MFAFSTLSQNGLYGFALACLSIYSTMLVLTKKEDPFLVSRLYFDNYYNIKYVIKFTIKSCQNKIEKIIYLYF